MGLVKNILIKMFENAMGLNKKNILDLLDERPDSQLLDLGCDDGAWSMALAGRIGTKRVYGIDIVPERLALASQKGVSTTLGDLNGILPYETESFDVVHANQVIEHISNLDLFVSEIRRILKPQGYVVISTENASSWHNVFAAIMGWQIFSLTNLTVKKAGLGNPLALHRNAAAADSGFDMSSWTHKVIFAYSGLREFLEVHGFSHVRIKGAGYYPLPAALGDIDRRHSHFITMKAYKRFSV